jgi:hypothetical protein
MAYQNKKKQKKTFLLSNSILGYLFPVLSSNVVYDSIHYLVVISFVSLLLSFSPCCQLCCCQVLSKFPCLSFGLGRVQVVKYSAALWQVSNPSRLNFLALQLRGVTASQRGTLANPPTYFYRISRCH